LFSRTAKKEMRMSTKEMDFFGTILPEATEPWKGQVLDPHTLREIESACWVAITRAASEDPQVDAAAIARRYEIETAFGGGTLLVRVRDRVHEKWEDSPEYSIRMHLADFECWGVWG
jgi:hypothetical protein